MTGVSQAGCGNQEGGGHGYSNVCGQPEWGPDSRIYRCRECLIAELERQVQWRGMEDAPKDGRWVLLRGGSCLCWHDDPPPVVVGRWFDGAWLIPSWDWQHDYVDPTDWMPLP